MQNISGVTLSSDNVFGDGWDAELATVTGDPASGMTVALTIGVGEKSTSAPPPGGPPRGGPPPNGRPPGPPHALSVPCLPLSLGGGPGLGRHAAQCRSGCAYPVPRWEDARRSDGLRT